MQSISILFGIIWLSFGCISSQPSKAVKVRNSNALNAQASQGGLIKKIKIYGGLTISVPNSWKKSSAQRSFVLKPPCIKSEAFCQNMVVSIVKAKNAVSLKQYAEIIAQKMHSQFSEYSTINTQEVTISSREALVLDYKFVSDNTSLGGTSFLIRKGEKICMIHCMAANTPISEYAARRKIFFKAAQSITWD